MNKQDFLNKLKEDLSSLTDEELKNALKYYDEYFADAHEEEVEQQIEEFNFEEDIKEAAENNATFVNLTEPVRLVPEIQEKPDVPSNNNSNGREIKKLKKKSRAMIIILLICFSPMWLPVAMAAAGALFALLMAFLSLSIGLGCAAVGGLVAAGAGVFSIGYGVMHIFMAEIGEALYNISVGLVATGVGIILAYIFGKLALMLFRYEFKFLGFLGKKIFKPARQSN